jgi:hypothetical protein
MSVLSLFDCNLSVISPVDERIKQKNEIGEVLEDVKKHKYFVGNYNQILPK